MGQRKCFVISVFGKDGPEQPAVDRRTYEQAQAVMQELIEPAIAHVNARVSGSPLSYYRGDQVPGTGPIVKRIHNSIWHEHILIAVLLRQNENVAYEIGVADAMGRPIILLAHEAYPVPFDLLGRQMILFRDGDLVESDGDRHQRGVIEELAATIAGHLPASQARDFAPSLLREHSVPLGRCLALDRFHIPYDEWSTLLLDAHSEIWLSGIALFHVLTEACEFQIPVVDNNGDQVVRGGQPQFRKGDILTVLAAQCAAGVDVNILLMDPVNPALPGMLASPTRRLESEMSKVRYQIGEVTARLKREIDDLAATARQSEHRFGTFRFTQVRQGLLLNRVSMTDQFAYVTPLFLTTGVNTGPSFATAPKSARESHGSTGGPFNLSLYGSVQDDLRFLQGANPTITMYPDGTIDRPAGVRALDEGRV